MINDYVEFLQFAINQEEMRQKWLAAIQECQRLHAALEKAVQEATDLDKTLSHAKRRLDDEKRKRQLVEEQRNSLVMQHYDFYIPIILNQYFMKERKLSIIND